MTASLSACFPDPHGQSELCLQSGQVHMLSAGNVLHKFANTLLETRAKGLLQSSYVCLYISVLHHWPHAGGLAGADFTFICAGLGLSGHSAVSIAVASAEACAGVADRLAWVASDAPSAQVGEALASAMACMSVTFLRRLGVYLRASMPCRKDLGLFSADRISNHILPSMQGSKFMR